MIKNLILQKIPTGMLVFFTAFYIAACTSSTPGSTAEISTTSKPHTLTVMTHDSFSVSEDVVTAFENEYNAEIRFLKSGDTGTALNKAILSKGNPLADVFYGVDNTFLSRALDEEIFEPYDSPLLADIDDDFELDQLKRALPVDFGDVCLNYDKNYFVDQGITPPQTLENLLEPEYEGLLVVQNPATSSPGLAFMFTTIGHFGEDYYLDYWKGLLENDALIVNDWETAYYTEFSASAGRGPRPIVVSYNSSPAFEVIYAETALDEPPTAAVVSDDTCFRQIEFVGILKGGQNRELAEKWVDFMLSPIFQEDIPLQMYVFPVNSHALLDDAFIEHLTIPTKTAFVSPENIATNREKWLREWTETVLR
jgi:thiamine transport system substrate-binding protein